MKLFNLDSPVMVFLSKVANLMILNVLTIGRGGDYGTVLCDDQNGERR